MMTHNSALGCSMTRKEHRNAPTSRKYGVLFLSGTNRVTRNGGASARGASDLVPRMTANEVKSSLSYGKSPFEDVLPTSWQLGHASLGVARKALDVKLILKALASSFALPRSSKYPSTTCWEAMGSPLPPSDSPLFDAGPLVVMGGTPLGEIDIGDLPTDCPKQQQHDVPPSGSAPTHRRQPPVPLMSAAGTSECVRKDPGQTCLKKQFLRHSRGIPSILRWIPKSMFLDFPWALVVF